MVRSLAGSTDEPAPEATDKDQPVSIHETTRMKEPGLAELLVYDAYERRSALLRVIPLDATPDDWAAARAVDVTDLVDGPFEVMELGPGRLVVRRDAKIGEVEVSATKTIDLGGARRSPTLTLTIDLEHRGGPAVDARIGIEWSLTMLGGGGNPAAWWDVGGERTAHDGRGAATGIETIGQGNDYIGVSVTSSTTRRRTPGGHRSRRSRIPKTGSSACIRAAGSSCPGRSIWLQGSTGPARSPTSSTTTRDRASEEADDKNPSARGLRATG